MLPTPIGVSMLRCQAELLPSPHPAPIWSLDIHASLRGASSLVKGIRASAHGRAAGWVVPARRYVPRWKVECAVIGIRYGVRCILFRWTPETRIASRWSWSWRPTTWDGEHRRHRDATPREASV